MNKLTKIFLKSKRNFILVLSVFLIGLPCTKASSSDEDDSIAKRAFAHAREFLLYTQSEEHQERVAKYIPETEELVLNSYRRLEEAKRSLAKKQNVINSEIELMTSEERASLEVNDFLAWSQSSQHQVTLAKSMPLAQELVDERYKRQKTGISHAKKQESYTSETTTVTLTQEEIECLYWLDIQEFQDANVTIDANFSSFDSIELCYEGVDPDNIIDTVGELSDSNDFSDDALSDRGILGETADFLHDAINRPDSPPKIDTVYGNQRQEIAEHISECIPDAVKDGWHSFSDTAKDITSEIFSKLSPNTRQKIQDGLGVFGDTFELVPTYLRRGLRGIGVSQENAQIAGEFTSDAMMAAGLVGVGKIVFKAGGKVVGKISLPKSNINTSLGAQSHSSNLINKIKLRRRLLAEEIAQGHAFDKHVVCGKEFPGIKTKEQFQSHIENLFPHLEKIKTCQDGRIFYMHKSSRTVVYKAIKKGESTCFRVPKEKWKEFLADKGFTE